MSGLSHERPGWYRDPDDPRKLRYWDGAAWTGRSRKKPPWALKAEVFEVPLHDADRSIEGPVHPWELRAPAYSAAAKEWLSLRLRPPLHSWHRRGAGGRPAAPSSSGRAGAPAKLGPARRPLLALMSLLVVAVAVVASGIAVISPYEKGQQAAQVAVSRFAVLASKDCQATLPKYREVLATGTDGPSVAAAAHKVDLLRRELASIPAGRLVGSTITEWLQAWEHFTADQRRYAEIVGPSRPLGASPGKAAKTSPSTGLGRARVPPPAAQSARRDARKWASLADQLSTYLQATSCRLEPGGRG
jgi:hypothetical protein